MSATLATTIELFLIDLQCSSTFSSGTLQSYRRQLGAAALALPGPLTQLEPQALERWIVHAATPAVVARRRAALRRLFAWAVAAGRHASDPFGRRITAAAQAFSAEERGALDAVLLLAPMPFRLAFVLLCETEIGVGELLALTAADVRLAPGYECLHIRARGRYGAWIVLLGPIATPRSLRLLHSVFHSPGADVLERPLLNGPLGPVSYSALRHHWRRLCARAGLVDQRGVPRYTLSQIGRMHGAALFAPRFRTVAGRRPRRVRAAQRSQPTHAMSLEQQENE